MKLEGYHIQEYDISEGVGKVKIPLGFILGSAGDEHSAYRIPFDLIAKEDATIKFVHNDAIKKHLKQWP